MCTAACLHSSCLLYLTKHVFRLFMFFQNSPLSRRTHAHKASSFWMNRFSDSNRRKMLRCDYIKVLACLSALLISLLMSFLFWFLFPFYFGSVSVFHRKINGFFNVPFFFVLPIWESREQRVAIHQAWLKKIELKELKVIDFSFPLSRVAFMVATKGAWRKHQSWKTV